MTIPSISHVAILSSPGLGHLTPILELAKRLVTQHELTITIYAVVPTAHKPEDELLTAVTSSFPNGLINAVVLPIEKQDLPSNLSIFSRVLAMVRTVFPALRASISGLENKPIAMIVDQFGTEAIEAVGRELNIMKYYLFFASNAMFLSFNLFLPYVDKVARDEPFYMPGCEPIMGEDLLELTFSPTERGYQDFVNVGVNMATVDGILVNTWEDLEAKTLLAFRDEMSMKPIVKPPVYPIGPLVRTNLDEPTNLLQTGILKWLNHQPNESVVYVSFGSGGTISTQQTIELAWGLELSKQRFIWVMRPPIENNSAASLFKMANDVGAGLSEYLPDDFVARTRDVGYLVPLWAPQEEILSHQAIGAFVSHCGWNSALESIVNGLPIITWPLYAEQNMNSTMLVEQLKVAVRPEVKQPSKKVVGRDEIATLLTRLMEEKEGREIRSRVLQFKESANKGLREGGSSYSALSKVVQNIVA